MRILAIRGSNLASLGGDFAVDFTAEPLGSAGLYAITGPTGSGKSTLLDALCLALYDRTPRLARTGAGTVPDVGDEAISLGDVRSVLRRGAGEGHAEVDFVGIDGLSYRARWTARRARKRGDGKLQAVSMSLVSLPDEQAVGGGLKTEVLPAIASKVGLSFEQFTRAVLLAQNEFAAFLKANDNERAELLELLTGTERFSQLSRRAFARAKEENEALERLRLQLAGQAPLSAEDRGAIDAETTRAATRLRELEAQRDILATHLRWHEQRNQAAQAVTQAQKDADHARHTADVAGDRRDALAQVDRVQSGRGRVEAKSRLTQTLAELHAGKQTAQNAHAQAVEQQKAADAALLAARTAMDQAEQERTAQQPVLQQARALDTSITLLRPQVDQSAKDLSLARASEATAKTELDKGSTALAQTSGQAEANAQWLAANTALQPLAEGWDRWSLLLNQASATVGEINSATKDLAHKEAVLASTSVTRDGAQLALAKTDALLSAARDELAKQEAALLAIDATALANQRKAIDGKRPLLNDAMRHADKLLELTCRREVLKSQKETADKSIFAAQSNIATADSQLPASKLALQTAEKALLAAKLAASEHVENLREQLEKDSPCPVCGALDHPYSQQAPAVEAILKSLEEGVQAARGHLETIQSARVAAFTALGTLEPQSLALANETENITTSLGQVHAEWNALVLPGAPDAIDARAPWVANQIAALTSDAEALARAEEILHRTRQLSDAARKAVDALQIDHTKSQTTLAEAAARVQTEAAACMTARELLSRLEEQKGRHLDALMPAFADNAWRSAWTADPAQFAGTAAEQAQRWRTEAAQRDTLAKAMATLVAESTRLGDTVNVAGERRTDAEARWNALNQDLIKQMHARSELLSGRGADEVEKSLAEVLKVRKAQFDTAVRLAGEAGVAHAGAQTTLIELGERSTRCAAELEAAMTNLSNWIRDQNALYADWHLDEERLIALLAHDEPWRMAERQALDALDKAVHQAAAIVKDRQDRLEGLDQTRPTQESADALQQTRLSLQETLQECSEAISQLKARQIEDDRRRSQAASLAGEIAAQEMRATTWGRLNELIGSSDGSRFRKIAQQVSLDVLLAYANRHLTSLARRYRLERIADTLGLTVVDQDMGDEVRSVHSLSGGESFLVSLALALGLASLSSHRIRVESLFIDEGFGSLDTDALRLAMEALDSLQAQGRKVGVISHVLEMTERISTQIRVERETPGRSRVVVGSF